jgi:tRNA(fMet)-specific endonuclease VapC
MRYLLDTNVVSDLVRNPRGRWRSRSVRSAKRKSALASLLPQSCVTGPPKNAPRLSAQLEAVLGALEVLPFETPADAAYGVLRAQLEQASRPISANDLLIAAQAIALDYTIVTDNEKEFARVPNLPRENWLR